MHKRQVFSSVVGIVVLCLMARHMETAVAELGVNWGRISSDPLSNDVVVQMLKDNNFVKVKLFDANSEVIESMRGINLEVMVAITNDMLATIAASIDAAAAWVKANVTSHLGNNGVNIKYAAVGNEPFLTGYNGKYVDVTLPALKNVQAALAAAGLAETVKAVVPCNADILSDNSYPSQQTFRADLAPVMLDIVTALQSTNSPFVVNLYPFLNLVLQPTFPVDFAFFTGYNTPLVDGTRIYTNVFDASFDGVVVALNNAGYPNMDVIVGEIGWPTDGANYATIELAQKFNQQLVNHLESGVGTPLRPGKLEAYVFGLLDENAKSTLPGNFERHWGIFNFDGTVKYPLDLTGGVDGTQTALVGSKNVPYYPRQWCVLKPTADLSLLPANLDYACGSTDCTPLFSGGSCSGLTLQQNASYAFNNYYQFNNQLPSACDFQGLAQVTTTDPSSGTCKFTIGVRPVGSQSIAAPGISQSQSSASPTVSFTVLLIINLLIFSCIQSLPFP